MTDTAPANEPIPVIANDPITVVDPIPVANEAPPINSPLLAEQLPPNEPQVKPARLLSLDVFRGITLAMMTVVNNTTGETYYQFDHAKWGRGWTATDLVFPFFLFIVGVAIPFSLKKRSSIGQTQSHLLGTIWLRALGLFMVGQLLAGLSNLAQLKPIPPEFHLLPIMRWVCVIYAYAALILLLVPFRLTRRSWVIPVGVCVSFYALCGIMALVNHNAIVHGLVINAGGMLKPASMRIPGIVQRIGFCYGVAATIMLYAGWRTALLTSFAACALYTVLMFYAPFHDPVSGRPLAGTITEHQNFARSVDEAVFTRYTLDANGKRLYTQNHTWREYPDNEGLVSTLPALTNALFGAIAGLWLRSLRPAGERCAGLFVFGVLAMLLGLFLDAHSIPIIKTIWTPSYAVFTAGLAMIGLGMIYFTVDINGYRKWSWPFVVLGMNSIAVFVANNFVYRVNNMFKVATPFPNAPWNDVKDDHVWLGRAWEISTNGLVHGFADWFHRTVSPSLASVQTHFSPHGPMINNEANTSLFYAFTFLIVVWLLMLILYVCKIFVKI